MQLAVVVVALHTLPALGVLAILLLLTLLRTCTATFLLGESEVVLLLSEIQTLSRVDLATDSLLEVFIANFAIPVGIKFVEKLLELKVSDPSKAPVVKIELELLWFNGP